MPQSQPMPSTISFDRQFADLPLVTVVTSRDKITTFERGPGRHAHACEVFTGPTLSGHYEVTATRDGVWHISDLWVVLDGSGALQRTMNFQVLPGNPLWDLLIMLLTAHYGEAIEARIAEELTR